jgi:hypothetical protein
MSGGGNAKHQKSNHKYQMKIQMLPRMTGKSEEENSKSQRKHQEPNNKNQENPKIKSEAKFNHKL